MLNLINYTKIKKYLQNPLTTRRRYDIILSTKKQYKINVFNICVLRQRREEVGRLCGQSQEGTYIQCTNCGEIYRIDYEIPLENVYVTCYCSKCEHERGLNLGSDQDDLYANLDPVLDERYY